MNKQIISLIAFIALVILGLVLPSQKQALPKNSSPQIEESSRVVDSEPSRRDERQAKPKRISSGEFTSPAGIRYGKDWSGKFDSRIAHIMAHTRPDPSKPKHSMFREKSQDGIIKLLDEAWKKRGPPERQTKGRGREVFDVDMGRVVGTEGERHIRIVVEADSADIVTAYPVSRP